MTRQYVIQKLSDEAERIRKQFSVRRLLLFGSIARDEGTQLSDADILVEFDGPATFDGFMDLKFFLEELLGVSVDLVTNKSMRPLLRPIIEQEAIRVA